MTYLTHFYAQKKAMSVGAIFGREDNEILHTCSTFSHPEAWPVLFFFDEKYWFKVLGHIFSKKSKLTKNQI